MIKEKKIKPILKWAGGKTSELPIIHQYLPKNLDNYYEPFIGGGAVWLSMDIKGQMLVNDFSEDLINLYKVIKEQDKDFLMFIERFNKVWLEVGNYCEKNKDYLKNLYLEFKNDIITQKDLNDELDKIAKDNIISFYFKNENLTENYKKYLLDKFKRTKNNESKKGDLPQEDYIKNIETGFKAALYMYIRELYNLHLTKKEDFNSGLTAAIYFIIRDLSYSGMFRYNKNGEFNVPYGGMGYNNKDFNNKMQHITSEDVIEHFQKTVINKDDFYDFMKKYPPNENDFIFLDPPYDTEFSSYDGNSFDLKDQKRLSDYLINECKAKWMVVIKYTDYIYSLYNKKDIEIIFFDKRYAVSFMDRNEQEVQHILIRNYRDDE